MALMPIQTYSCYLLTPWTLEFMSLSMDGKRMPVHGENIIVVTMKLIIGAFN